MLYKLTNDNQSHLLGTNNQTFPNPCHPHAPSKKICLGKKYDFSEIGRGINFTLVERKIPLVPKKSLVIFCGGDLPPAAVSKQREEKKERRRRRREKKGKKAEAVACLECGGKVSKDGKRRRGGGRRQDHYYPSLSSFDRLVGTRARNFALRRRRKDTGPNGPSRAVRGTVLNSDGSPRSPLSRLELLHKNNLASGRSEN